MTTEQRPIVPFRVREVVHEVRRRGVRIRDERVETLVLLKAIGNHPCIICGEIIHRPVPHPVKGVGPLFICERCCSDRQQVSGQNDAAVAADMQYHGGRFNHGEW